MVKNYDSDRRKKSEFKIWFVKKFYFIILPIIIYISYVLSSFLIVDTNILPVIVTASAFIVAIISGFLINSYYNVNQLRWGKVERFSELQNRLKDYAQAFYWFTHELTRKYQLNYRFSESIEKLERDTDWNYNNDESVAVRFVRYLKEFAGNPYDIPDFELSHAIITKKKLEDVHRYLNSAAGLLSRHKHFKYILQVFKLKDTSDLDEVIIVNSTLVNFQTKKIIKQGEDFRTLGFWDAKISECEEILARMIANGKFVYSFNVFEIQHLGLNLLFISIFGILLPVVILMLNSTIENYQSFLSLICTIGFVTYFGLGIVRIYRKLSSPQLSYS